jgi:hypothetical protein
MVQVLRSLGGFKTFNTDPASAYLFSYCLVAEGLSRYSDPASNTKTVTGRIFGFINDVIDRYQEN